MNGVVVDASVALAWCFPDESSDSADAVLLALEGKTMLVPAVWALEIAKALLVGERSQRLRQPDISRFAILLESLSPVQDAQPVAALVSYVLPLARQYGLSAYDAAYLELAMRRGAGLATLDGKLRRAARKAGVEIVHGQVS